VNRSAPAVARRPRSGAWKARPQAERLARSARADRCGRRARRAPAGNRPHIARPRPAGGCCDRR